MKRWLGLCGLAWLLVSGTAQAATVSGVVDATGVTAAQWHDTYFSTAAVTTISASLDWTNTRANLDLFLFRRRSDGSWANVAWGNSATARPEKINYANAAAGEYRL